MNIRKHLSITVHPATATIVTVAALASLVWIVTTTSSKSLNNETKLKQ